jgi:hypothetical protein
MAKPRYPGGDGDACPLDPAHGRMYAYVETQMQFCPHSAHKTESRYEWDGITPRTGPRAPVERRTKGKK